jgi:hypothetical protein
MAKIKINSYPLIDITTIEDYPIVGVDNVKLDKVVGTHKDNANKDQDITVIVNGREIFEYFE